MPGLAAYMYMYFKTFGENVGVIVSRKMELNECIATFLSFLNLFNLNSFTFLYLIYVHVGKRAIVGYEDGSIKVWDLKEANHTFHLSGLTSVTIIIYL